MKSNIDLKITYGQQSSCWFGYSHLSNSQGGWNKRGGGAKVAKSMAGILLIIQRSSMLE